MAEDGYKYRFNSQNKNSFEWNDLVDLDDSHDYWMD